MLRVDRQRIEPAKAQILSKAGRRAGLSSEKRRAEKRERVGEPKIKKALVTGATRAKSNIRNGTDETRTRDLRRDRPAF